MLDFCDTNVKARRTIRLIRLISEKGEAMVTAASAKPSSCPPSRNSFASFFSQLGKNLTVLLFLVPLATAQTVSPVAAGGCGPAGVHFEVKTEKQHPLVRPENGKALVYLIQDDTQFQSRPRPTTRIGIDGTWVGATKSNSYFHVSVDPGEHDLCSNWQSFVGFNKGHTAAAVRFKAEAGQTYYFLVRNSWVSELQKPAEIELKPVNGAEGQLLASKFSLSISHPK